MKKFWVVVQIDEKTDREIRRFNTAKEAELETGIGASDVSKCIYGLYKQAGGYKWEKWFVDKRIFVNQQTLAIDEYLFLRDISYEDLSALTGISREGLRKINSNGYCNLGNELKLQRLNIDVSKRVDPSQFVYVRDAEQWQPVDEYVKAVIRCKGVGKFKCADEVEANEVHRILNGFKIANYIIKKGLMYCVKYDATIQEG